MRVDIQYEANVIEGRRVVRGLIPIEVHYVDRLSGVEYALKELRRTIESEQQSAVVFKFIDIKIRES